MNGPLFFAVLMVLLFAFGIAMFWQESRRMQQSEVIYGIEDSIEFIWDALAQDQHGLKKSDVRRILEWEMHYLQQPSLWQEDGHSVVGGEAAAIYTQNQALAEGFSYEPDQIFVVMDLQAECLAAIGAVGDPVEPGD